MPIGRIAHFLLTLLFIASPISQGQGIQASQIREDHPKLLASKEDFDRLRARLSDPLGQELLAFIRETGEALLTAEPAQYRLKGIRLLDESRTALKHLSTFAFLYRVYVEDKYKEKTIAYLDHVTGFPNWNPRHYLDVGEMTLAVSIAVDWLWDELSAEQRDRYLQAIIEKGLEPSLDESLSTNWWMYYNNNWNPVCHSGLTAGAILIADRQPDLTERIINRAIKAVPIAMAETDPDGVYPEGPTYWNYGTEFSIFFIDLLNRAVGHSFGLENHVSFKKSMGFRAMSVTPTGKFYNFFDSGPRLYYSPAATWFAKTYGMPTAHLESRRLIKNLLTSGEWTRDNFRHRTLAFTALWYPEDVPSQASLESDLPQFWQGHGDNPVAMIRSSWVDTNAFFLGFKGGLGSISHAHMDAGSFIYEDEGVRWAVDLGAQTYLSLESKNVGLWDRRQNSDRWRVFRLGPYSHNLMLIDEQLHDVTEPAPLSNIVVQDNRLSSSVDLSVVNQAHVKTYKRTFTVHDMKVLQIDDRIAGARKPFEHEGRNSASLHWRMVTQADVSVDGDRAILKQDGKTCYLKVALPEDVPFTLRSDSLDPPPYYWDEPNPGHQAIDIWLQADPEGNRDLTILISTDSGALDNLADKL